MRLKRLGVALILLLWGQTAMAGTLLILGDSISAGFGLDSNQGWVSLLQRRLLEKGREDHLVNASLSGETSAGGLARLPGLLSKHRPQWVIVELGGNDGLRGQPTTALHHNLSQIIELSRAAGAQVLLLGMRLPANYGQRYTTAFAGVYQQLAEQQQVASVRFFLEGVGGVPALMQADGIHPTAQAQPLLLDNLWPVLEPLL